MTLRGVETIFRVIEGICVCLSLFDHLCLRAFLKVCMAIIIITSDSLESCGTSGI